MSFVRVGASDRGGREAARDLGPHLGPAPAAVFAFGSPKSDVPAMCAELAGQFPEAAVVGCTTMGELGPDAFTTEAVSAFALGAPARAAAYLVEDLHAFEVVDAQRIIEELSERLGGPPVPGKHVIVTLIDGLSGLDELLVASLALAAPGVALVGGSAGDDFAFVETLVAVGDRVSACGGVVLLLEPGVPFEPFRAHNFKPTDKRMVVTEADPVARRVYEIDGRPGAEVVAEALEMSLDELARVASSAAVFGFGAQDHPFLRSVMAVQDGALVMGGAVERGAVLTLMRGEKLVERTREHVAGAIASLDGDPDGMLLFWCGGRQIETVAKGLTEQVHAALTPVRAAGFVTYGEHFGANQINHTLTGLVFGRPDD